MTIWLLNRVPYLCKPLNLVDFRCWMRYPFIQGLCLIAKETEQGVTIALFIIEKQEIVSNFGWLISWSRAGIQTWDLSICLYLNLKHGYLDHGRYFVYTYSMLRENFVFKQDIFLYDKKKCLNNWSLSKISINFILIGLRSKSNGGQNNKYQVCIPNKSQEPKLKPNWQKRESWNKNNIILNHTQPWWLGGRALVW